MNQKPRAAAGAVFDSDFIALFLVEDGRLVDANAAMHRALGYQLGELIGKPVRAVLLYRQDRGATHDEVCEAVQGGQPFSGTVQLARNDGSAGWYEVHITPLSGDPSVRIGAMIDRTADHARVLQLQVDEARYRAVVEDQTEVIGRYLPDGTLLFVNEAYCRMFGVSAEAITGRPWQPLVHPDDVPMVHFRLREMTPENPVVVIENRVVTAGGQMRWMQFVNRGFYDSAGSLVEVQAVGRDITPLKETERQLREADERLELALDGSSLVLWDWNIREGRVEAGNRLFDLLGYGIGELGNKQEDWLQLVHPQDLPAFDEKMSAHLRGETAGFESEHRLKHKAGHWVVVEARGKVKQWDPQGSPIRMVGTLLDVTQRKRLHDEGVQLLKRIESIIHVAASGSSGRAEVAKSTESLTKRERQILGMIAAGMTSAQIGAKLSLATPTVVTHRRSLMAKLDLHSTAEVTRFALQNGLLPDR